MQVGDTLSKEDVYKLYEKSRYVFFGGSYNKKLLYSADDAIILFLDPSEMVVISNKENVISVDRIIDPRYIKKISTGQGAITLLFSSKDKELSLLLDASERTDFMSTMSFTTLDENYPPTFAAVYPNTDQKDLTTKDLFIIALEEYGAKIDEYRGNATGFDIFAGLVITAALVLTPILKIWTPIIIIVTILIVYLKGKYL